MLHQIIRYFDLQSTQRRVRAEGHAATAHAPVLPQYLVVCLGIIIEPLLRNYTSTGRWDVDWSLLIGRTFFGLVVGVILLPSVYKSAFDTQKPVLVQLAALFPLGIGWQSLFETGTKITVG